MTKYGSLEDKLEDLLYTAYLDAREDLLSGEGDDTERGEALGRKALAREIIEQFGFEPPCYDVELTEYESDILTVYAKWGKTSAARDLMVKVGVRGEHARHFILQKLREQPNCRHFSVPAWEEK